ncbi:TonB-dependent receptor [Aquiflexum sp. LQ15W]|uniref:SusC/RagA family TonB-linked outer membrane protein n=1 Tax=Cognataquiflexum nitidum TaxID=2922272 RepID=UPI001F12CAAE|nr:TonB-dependent receptor [Cognataquiflexum nitidum]MCH6201003.1 TonB-dependent receptor [Cognataquiflexum nitidum]
MGNFTSLMIFKVSNSLKILSFILLLSFFIGTPLYSFPAKVNAEDFVIVSGRVKDAAGVSIPGVSILEKGTNNGTVTDIDGKFTINVQSSESVLVLSFIGYSSQEITVGSQSNIEVTLTEDTQNLSEVIVIGYGTQEKRDVTGAMATIKEKDFNRGIVNSPQDLIQGKVAGVNIVGASGEPGANQSITVRGPGGIRTGNTPLFVIDGVVLDNSSTGGAGNPLNFLNPQDIESIDVLKDASATAIYGSRGANGVIIVTTKKGKEGVSTLNYTYGLGVSNLARALDVFSADEYRKQVPAVGGILQDSLANTNWQKEITRTAITHNHNLSLNGGTEKMVYLASLSYQDQEGIIKESDLQRMTGRLNISQKLLPGDILQVGINLNAAQTVSNRPPITSVIANAISANPTFPAFGTDGRPFRDPTGNNPLRLLEIYDDITTINRVIGNITASLKLSESLVFQTNIGIDNANSTRDIQSLPSLEPQQIGGLQMINGNNKNFLIENFLTYTYKNDRHFLTAMGGFSYQDIFVQQRFSSINQFPISEIEPRFNPGLGQELNLANNRPGGFAVRNELQSFFGRVNYQLSEKYLATATIRADGSSKFGENNKYGVFPSFSLGWRLSEESFMDNLKAVSELKLRAGWGQTGNQEIPSKITQPLFTAQVSANNSYPLDGSNSFPAGITFTRLANPDIQWEVSTQLNLGLDFGLFENSLVGSVDYFRKVSNNILLEVIPADPVQPASTTWVNVEDMNIINSGVEINLNYRKTISNNMSFSIGGNTTFIDNVVKDSPFTVIPSGSATGAGLSSATINGYLNGHPIGSFYLLEHIGFNENGLNVFRDSNGDGIVNDKDRIVAGTALPNFQYNIFGDFTYKRFDIAFNFNGVSGNKVYDNTANVSFFKLRLARGLNTTPEAIEFPEESVNNPAPVSTRYLKEASFFRLNNLSIGYSVNTTSLGVAKWVRDLRFSLTGQNLFVITPYDGYDPEVNTDRTINGVSSFGIDYMSYPRARTIILGLNIIL